MKEQKRKRKTENTGNTLFGENVKRWMNDKKQEEKKIIKIEKKIEKC